MSDVLTSWRRTPYQTFAAFSVLFFTLLLSGLLFISVVFLQGLLQYVETRPRIIVYFQIKATEKEIFSVRDKLKETGKTEGVKYISKQEAYKIYKDFTKNDPLLLEMTSPDILPPSLEIDAKDPAYLAEIADFVKNQPAVDEVQYQKDIVENLLSITSKVRKVTAVFFSYLLFMSIIVLTTTLLFKIALKKEEILLQRLLGATNWYIRKPFVKESIALGLFAALCANIVLISSLVSLNAFLHTYFAGVNTLAIQYGPLYLQVWPMNLPFIGATIAVTTIFSLVIAMSASFMATNRYLE